MFQLHQYTLPYTKTKEKQKLPEIKKKRKLTTTYTSRTIAQRKKKKLKLNNLQQNKFLASSQLGEVSRQFEMKVAKDGYDHASGCSIECPCEHVLKAGIFELLAHYINRLNVIYSKHRLFFVMRTLLAVD